MNKTVTSKENILLVSKTIASQGGLQEINMRNVAQQCGVAVGSVYHYFPSKDALMIATIGEIWNEILQTWPGSRNSQCFLDCVKELFQCVKQGGEKYPFFFRLHAANIAKSGKVQGREAMLRYFDKMKEELLASCKADSSVDPLLFQDTCSEKAFIDFVFSNLMSLWMKQDSSCDVFLSLLKRTIRP
jgi:AcrR family transcriptional regulator